MIKQLLNSVIAKYRDLSVSRRSIICLSLRLRQIIDLLATDKSRYFAQPRPIIVNCLLWGSRAWQSSWAVLTVLGTPCYKSWLALGHCMLVPSFLEFAISPTSGCYSGWVSLKDSEKKILRVIRNIFSLCQCFWTTLSTWTKEFIRLPRRQVTWSKIA